MTAQDDTIRFYRSNEKPYGCFSNLYRCRVDFEGIEFAMAEAAYQFGKPRKEEVRNWLMDAPSPSLMAMAAHGLSSWDIAPGWSSGRRDRMKRIVRAKFHQNTDLAAVLFSTGDKRIAESTKTNNDVNRRWGEVLIKGEWVGQNLLGLILMEVRELLRQERAF